MHTRKTIKRTAALIIMMVLIFLTSACAGNTYIGIITGGSGGSYYPVGEAIAEVMNDNIENTTVKAEAGYGSIANCFLLESGDASIAMVESNIAMWAYRGEMMFEGEPMESFQVIAALYPHPIQIVSLTGLNIAAIPDLEGKRVCLGDQDTAMYQDAVNVLDSYYITPSDIDVHAVPYIEGLYQLKDGEADAVFLTASEPNATVNEITQTHTIVLVPFDEDQLNALIESTPCYAPVTIMQGTYQSVDTDILAAATMTLLVCRADMDEEIVYRMTKALWENIEIVNYAHDQANKICLETAFDGVPIPIHPGAQRYYDEVAVGAEE